MERMNEELIIYRELLNNVEVKVETKRVKNVPIPNAFEVLKTEAKLRYLNFDDFRFTKSNKIARKDGARKISIEVYQLS
jgi:hypothetical protein